MTVLAEEQAHLCKDMHASCECAGLGSGLTCYNWMLYAMNFGGMIPSAHDVLVMVNIVLR